MLRDREADRPKVVAPVTGQDSSMPINLKYLFLPFQMKKKKRSKNWTIVWKHDIIDFVLDR